MVSRPPRIAVFGGDIRKLARDLADLHNLELFGSTGQTGQGELRRMLASLRAGALQQVCLVIRWAGHGEIDAIRKLCRTLGITCHSFHSFGAVRRWLKGDSASLPPRPGGERRSAIASLT